MEVTRHHRPARGDRRRHDRRRAVRGRLPRGAGGPRWSSPARRSPSRDASPSPMPTGSAGWWSDWASATTGTPRARASPRPSPWRARASSGPASCAGGCPRVAPTRPPAIVEGTLLGAYRFTRYKGGDDEDDAGRVERLVVSAGRGPLRAGVPRGRGGRGAERRPRPAEHPGQRHDADAARRAGARAGGRPRRADRGGRGPRGDRDAGHGRVRRGGEGQLRGTGADHAALRGAVHQRPDPRPRGQGRDLRHRRDLDQALGQDGGDEVRHVGRRRGLEAMGAIARLRLPGEVVAVVGATENMPSGPP